MSSLKTKQRKHTGGLMDDVDIFALMFWLVVIAVVTAGAVVFW